MFHLTYITEQCGARWCARINLGAKDRAYWVFLISGRSMAKPGTVGFYAESISDACAILSNY